jgi:hypothetical protein
MGAVCAYAHCFEGMYAPKTRRGCATSAVLASSNACNTLNNELDTCNGLMCRPLHISLMLRTARNSEAHLRSQHFPREALDELWESLGDRQSLLIL